MKTGAQEYTILQERQRNEQVIATQCNKHSESSEEHSNNQDVKQHEAEDTQKHKSMTCEF